MKPFLFSQNQNTLFLAIFGFWPDLGVFYIESLNMLIICWFVLDLYCALVLH